MQRALFAVLALALSAGGCSRATRPSFPPPVRAPVFLQLDFETAFGQLLSVMESRNYPLVVEDAQFGTVRTDWVTYEAGEVDLSALATCPPPAEPATARMRARFGFDVRRRTVQTTVTLLTQWQIERLRGFEESDRGWVDCRSTGEWERGIESMLTQRGTIR
jgi:hypothetical protein